MIYVKYDRDCGGLYMDIDLSVLGTIRNVYSNH